MLKYLQRVTQIVPTTLNTSNFKCTKKTYFHQMNESRTRKKEEAWKKIREEKKYKVKREGRKQKTEK